MRCGCKRFSKTMENLPYLIVLFLVIPSVVRPDEPALPQYLKVKYRPKTDNNAPTQTYRAVKTKTKTATHSPMGSGMRFRGGCNSTPPTPQNAGIRCSQYSGCRADCLPSYQFPNGATQLFITCVNGKWIIEGGVWEYVPSCAPICMPPCQNRGICMAPNQCHCPESFSGPYCQFENKPCMNYPEMPTNSRRSCKGQTCTISCLQGNQFPDGSSIATMSCKNGFWVPDKEKWTSLPDCEPICDPPCLNGGNCLSFGHCQCPQDFRGPQCQYRTDVCDSLKLQFNGGYNCSGDHSSLSCSLSCPEGMDFDIRAASVYNCRYDEGTWTPEPMPKCIFSDPQPGTYYSHNYYQNKPNYTNFNMNSLTVNGFPEVEYVPAGQRWNTYQSGNHQQIPHYGTNDFNYVTENPYEPSAFNFIQQKLPERGICVTWGGSHYKSFDGKVFSFSSKCAHTLIRDAVDNTFSIVVQDDPYCNYDPTRSCSKIIRVYFDKKEYILKRSPDGVPIFATPKKKLPIPGQLPGLRIEMSAHYIMLTLDNVGSKIIWDGQHLVQVEVQESLWNRTDGLCGNIDGDPMNDMTNKNGVRPQTVSNFAVSWKVETLESECNDLPSEEHACFDDELETSRSHQATMFCKKLLNDQRFAPCHNIMDVSLLLDACRWDYCSCKNSDPSICACETMNVYVKTCSYKGVKNLATWRDEKTCPMQCTGGRIYKACGSPAGQAVCGATSVYEEDDTESCVEGCYCPSGTVLHENRCITRDKCPCRLRTKSFPPGAQVPKECNTCTCSDGKWVCTQISCGSRCAAIGDPHYTTFDGKRYDFMGQCSYYLVKTPTFSIEAENVACAGSISEAMNLPSTIVSGLPSCTKTVTIRISGQTIKLKQNNDVVVNGMDVASVPYQIANVTIRSVSSVFLQVELPNGVLVWWDGATRAYIDIPANFPEKTRGLCGTFNNNQKDDFITPENDIEQAIIPFANKWKTNERCNDVPDVLKSHPCSTNIQNQPKAEEHCRKLKSNLFTACHWIVDPEPYYQDCLYDMCSCEYKTSKCLCPTIAAYAEECSRQGVKISWRDSIRECGIHCPRGQKYQVCGNSCTRTCFDVATRPDCRSQCVEGCNCPDGEALDDNGECIPIGECKCHYHGIQFPPGYQEVRAASRGPELCTCINAIWSCRPANEMERKKFPEADNLKSLCKASENMEFTTCEPAEPITCKNMHNPDYFSASVCHAGCKCKEGYVLDTTSKKCVKPSECPCHHGGKSYKESETVNDDCNTCTCANGKWECTDRPCAAECSAWGDSHFKTFDGKHYDFQGQCDYALAKGTTGIYSFDVIIQNVPCGTLGTSCPKSVIIRIKIGDSLDLLTLTSEKSIPEFAAMKQITVRKKGLFVIVEAADLGLVIMWDRGTRVYVKVDPRWKNKVKGLCGNYNDNDADDFQTPSGGIPEVSALIFGDSWKLQSYCPAAQEITSTCDERPDRKVWALKQCGILKSSLFAPCHSEVPVDTYLEKCIFDTCACDQGGDCECLCTALAAYAQECNTRGVPIKWRSQNMCPMQCDERCSNYSPCISTCPVTTCDNLLTESQMSKTCNEDNCIEGCLPKPCPEGQVYLNSSFSECIPRNICKPICMEIDGKTYNEGEYVEGDECHSCHCSRGTKVCNGQPCSTQIIIPTTELPTSVRREEEIKCVSGWTEWINQDEAKPMKSLFGKKKYDVEPLPSLLLLNNLKGAKCDKSKMADIECRTVLNKTPAKETKLDAECSLERGLICNTTSVWTVCEDFEIRVLCECEERATTISVPETCDPQKAHLPHPTDCSMFYHCEDGPDGSKYIEKTCGETMYFNPVTMVCDWPYNVVEIKPECKQPTSKPIIEEDQELKTPSVSEGRTLISECPPMQRLDNCAIKCDQLCLYYSYILKSEGYCANDKKCESGCVNSQPINCPSGMFWANNETCVSLKDCMCRSNDGKPVKPGTVYRESDCRVCQCINNYYMCDDSECESTTEKAEAVKVVDLGVLDTRPSKVVIGAGDNQVEILPPIYSTVTPPVKCEKDHLIDLLQGDQAVPNPVFNASSILSSKFLPQYAKFDVELSSESGGSWIPQYSNNLQYLEIDLGRQEPIYGIKIKGSPLYDEYVTSYKVSYSPDGRDNFIQVVNQDKLPQVFRGSIDTKTPVTQIFDVPFEAQIVKIHPETWNNGIALKVELIGCGELITTTVAYEFITTPATPILCDDPMGLDNSMMSDQQVSVSSEIDRRHSKSNLKLSDDSAWQPLMNSPTEFIKFDFLEPRNITGLKTKGGPNGWVTAYTVQYSQDDVVWNPVLEKKTKTEKVFLGNYDSDTPQIDHFDLPIQTKYIKLIPQKWHNTIQMRTEVLGCFEPYPTLSEDFTTPEPSPCNICPDVVSEPLEMNACRCEKDKWWDGENCVSRNQCPCYVGHIPYPVGSVFKKEDCSECLCKIGGVAHCTPKHCDPCEAGLRSKVTATCQCTCQPCPDNTTLCPTSNLCIDTIYWCDGIQHCPDDELYCNDNIIEAEISGTTPSTILTNEKKVKKCPEIQCPPGYHKKVKKPTKGRTLQSSTFSSYSSTPRVKTYSGIKTKGTKTSFRKTLSLKHQTKNVEHKLNCTEYYCESDKPAPSYSISKKECPPVTCPSDYIAMLEKEDYTTRTCPQYHCMPRPPPDSVCNVTGRTFNTFDGTEYKYDICDHVLARDIDNYKWEVGLRKNCTGTSCWHDLLITHGTHVLLLHPDLTVEYDGFSYTAQQAKKIASNTRSFSLFRIGNTLIFASNRYGFWIIWDKEANVKLGVTQKLLNTVDGLCGYFNDDPHDDKMKPDGSPAKTTVEFGDSWSYPGNAHICEPQVCPIHIQNKAWEICQVKHQSLQACNKVVNRDAFISRCIDTTCDCLQAAANNHTAEEECRCHTLENFVIECLTKEPSTDVADWRMELDCPATCEAPFVYHDCYQRKCEPTCESLSNPEASCPKDSSNLCFSGCYCPPGMVRKDDTCISPSTCRDCECNVLPHLQYVTYDNSNFTINGQCVYVMTRDTPDASNGHKFQVLITNAPCRNNQEKTCVGKVTILYEGRKIHILNDMNRERLRLIVDGEKIDDFASIDWARVTESASKHIKIKIPDIQADISVYYPSLGVSVKVPSQKYGGKLEGLCGDCNYNPQDDFRTPKGAIVDKDKFTVSWLYDKLPGGQTKEMCENKPDDCPPLPKESDPCKLILDYKTFGQCLRLLDPTLFLEWCRKDTCGNRPDLACSAIEAYARDCASAGFCINWRTNICPPRNCPSDKIYDPCGSKCPKTCENKDEKEKSCPDVPTEGCFCPEGQVLRNETCVVPEDCDVCDDEGHKPGDVWKKDRCTSCICDGLVMKCQTERCTESEEICKQGYQAVKVARKEDECCDKYACVPEPTSGPTCETPQQITCSKGQLMKLATKPNGCQQFVCECKPPEECEPVDMTTDTPLQDGYVKEIDGSGCCPEVKIVCRKASCPKPQPCQQFHILKNETGQCCPLHTCEPPKDKCIYENVYISAEEGGERPRTEIEKQQVLKNGNETWDDGPCRQCKCQKTTIGNYQASCTKTDCSPIEMYNDYLDYELKPELVYDQCCPDVKRVACKYDGKVYHVGQNWTVGNDHCTLYKCVNTTSGIRKEIDTIQCETNCELGFEYVPATPQSKECCGSCKPTACVIDGKVYQIGKEWTSDDFCVKYACFNTNGSMQVQSEKVNCPEPPQEYIEHFEIVTIPVKDQCCKEHKKVACKVGNKVYKVNETWPCPDGDICKKYTCVKTKTGDIIKQESVETCKTNCSKGWEYKKSNKTCCGECVRVACVVEEELKKPGENWTSPDNCTTYTCEKMDDEFIVTSHQESCPSIEDCPEEDIYVKGCCKHCNITSEAQKRCAPISMAVNKTVGLIKAERETHGTCVNKKPIKSFTECKGACESSTFFNLSKGMHESKCSCCQARKYTHVEVELECEDGHVFKKTVAVPSDCGCDGCSASLSKTKTKSKSGL